MDSSLASWCGGVAAALAMGWLAIPQAGCVVCNGDVCESRFVVQITEPDRVAFEDGQYVFDMTVDGEPQVITCVVGEAGKSVACEEEPGPMRLSALIVGHVSEPFTEFDLEARPDAELPTTFDLEVRHDGDVVLAVFIDANYVLSDPGCDADCVIDRRTHEFVR